MAFKEAFGAGATWQFLFKRSLIRMISEAGGMLEKVFESLFKVLIQISSRSE